MIGDKIQEALNQQINEEIFSAYLYLSMSAYFEDQNLPGFANWMRIQAQEEMAHAVKFYDHIAGRMGRVTLKAVKAPDTEWASPLAAFQAAHEHECYITGCINKLADLAAAEKDRAAGVMLQWFVTEQMEEEASADAVVQKLKMIGEAAHLLLVLDREMSQRTFPAPADQ